MKNNIINTMAKGALALAVVFAGGCSRDFLKPDPLSFYEPSTTFSTESGLQAVLAQCDRHIRAYWTMYQGTSNNVPITTEYQFSDMAMYGKSDVNVNSVDFNVADNLTPTAGAGGGGGGTDSNYIQYFWNESWNAIKYANTITTYIDQVEGLSEEKRNEYIGRAYFHRAFRYFTLVFQFGDVPLVTKIPAVPKQNFRSTPKEEILEMITLDMEKAVEWVPEQKDMTQIGMVNKGACRMLLAKLYLATGQFQKAEEQLDIIIEQSGYSLMRSSFGSFVYQGEAQTWPVTRNVIWDMHRPENKVIAANTETIMAMPNSGSTALSMIPFYTMRILGPMWDTGDTKDPGGVRAIPNNSRSNPNYNPTTDYLRALGRGIATVRPTWYASEGVWSVNGVLDEGDMRHSSELGNWVNMEDLKYSTPGSKWFGQNLRMRIGAGDLDNDGNAPSSPAGTMLCTDTLRLWFDYPHYKLYLFDVNAEASMTGTQFNGASANGTAHWYLYRLAEAYLLRAEAKFYQGDATAVADVNEVRERAGCTELYTTVDIGDIMDERARELYLEEWRNVELKRVSLCLALSGKPDEWGNTYTPETWDNQEGMERTGGSYWWQRVMHHNVYNTGGVFSAGKTFNFRIAKHNLYWPIPNAAMASNTKGQLKQNPGYGGNGINAEMWSTWEEAVADEDRTE